MRVHRSDDLLQYPQHHSIHFFTQSLSSFRNTCSYHRNLFCCSTEIMSSNPSLSLSTLYLELCLAVSCHTSIQPFSSLPAEVPPHFPLTGQVSLPYNILLRTQLLYNLPLTFNDTGMQASIFGACPKPG